MEGAAYHLEERSDHLLPDLLEAGGHGGNTLVTVGRGRSQEVKLGEKKLLLLLLLLLPCHLGQEGS